MSKAMVIDQYGGPEVFKLIETKIGRPGKGEILIKHTAIGINYIDIYQRKGIYQLPSLPAALGCEACGHVEDTGEGVEGLEIGDRVAYITPFAGAYCERRVISQDHVVAVPAYIPDDKVAALLLKGMTAHYLLFRTFNVKAKDIILVHAAAGGVGNLLCQWAKHLNATVIGTVGSEGKMALAKTSGCNYVINYNSDDFVQKVLEITDNKGVYVVYDSVGKATFFDSLKCLIKFGLMVSYGQASGPIGDFNIDLLAEKSLFLTRPSLFNYKSNRMELILSANEVFEMYKSNLLKLDKINTYKLSEVAKAHSDIEGRLTTGSSVILL